MKLHTLKYMFLSLSALAFVVACSDDDPLTIVQATCSDGIMNGTETGVDCGGASCQPCGDGMDPMEEPEAPDFSGTYAQVDFMGRPAINTVLSIPDFKDPYNQAIPNTIAEFYQQDFEDRLEGLHDVYAGLLGLDADDVDYETNILGLDATTLTTVLANDVLEVAPDAPTTYFNPGADDMDNDDNPLTLDGDEVGLTGRTLQDDVIDVSLILLFGGESGMRFSGQELEGGGMLPRLTSDGVAFTAEPTDTFPYLGAPE